MVPKVRRVSGSSSDIMFSVITSLLISMITGFVSAATTIAVIKTDIEWIKKETQALKDTDVRLSDRMDKIANVSHFQTN